MARVDAWRAWASMTGISGDFFDEPCSADVSVFDAGLASARRWLASAGDNVSAVLCITLPAVLGVLRAAHETGLVIGKDLSVCTVDSEGLGKYLCPSITSFERPNASPFLSQCFDWIAAGGKKDNWDRKLLMEPRTLRLFEGESTGPAPARAAVSSSSKRPAPNL
jgi:DNA-binding LacI/PurR family transcriptional regulator